jgi:hypothetical protein
MSEPPVDLGDLLDHLPPIMTPAQLGPLFGKTTQQMANERYFGRGPAFVKYGSRVFYLRSDVIAFLSANRHGGGDDS